MYSRNIGSQFVRSISTHDFFMSLSATVTNEGNMFSGFQIVVSSMCRCHASIWYFDNPISKSKLDMHCVSKKCSKFDWL